MTRTYNGGTLARELIHRVVESGKGAWCVMPMLMGIESFPDEKLSALWSKSTLGATQALDFELINWIFEQLKDPYSLSEALINDEFLKLAIFIKDYVRADAHTPMQLNYQMVSHKRAGKRVYTVSPGLAEKLRDTELRGLTADDLKLPYESLYIEVPEEARLKIWNCETGWHTVIGIYVTEETNMMLPTGEYPAQEEFGDIRGWRLLVVGNEKVGPVDPRLPEGWMDDALNFFRIGLPDGVKVDTILNESRKDMENCVRAPGTTWTTEMLGCWEEQFQWVMNVILYATWEEPGEHWIANKEARQLWERIQKVPPKSKKRSKLLASFQKIKPQKRLLLGKNIVINRKKSETPIPELSGKGWLPDLGQKRIKTRVSGHWKHVAYGQKSSQRRVQWIMPHWRNRDGVIPDKESVHALR